MKRLSRSQVTFVVMSKRPRAGTGSSPPPSASPFDRRAGRLPVEHPGFGEAGIAGDYAEELAAEMLATTLGLSSILTELGREEVYRLSNQSSDQNVTQTAVGDKKGLWTTVVAASVLVG
jgi:arginine decarboxylase